MRPLRVGRLLRGIRVGDPQRQHAPLCELTRLQQPVGPVEHGPDHDPLNADALLDVVAVPAPDDGDRAAVADGCEHAAPEQRRVEDGVDTLGNSFAHRGREPGATRQDDIGPEVRSSSSSSGLASASTWSLSFAMAIT